MVKHFISLFSTNFWTTVLFAYAFRPVGKTNEIEINNMRDKISTQQYSEIITK